MNEAQASKLTMTCKVTASREALTTRRTREGFRWAIIASRAATIVLRLILHLLLRLRVRVLWRLGNVVVVVQHGHRRLHLCRRGIAHAVHVLRGHLGVCRQLLLRLL